MERNHQRGGDTIRVEGPDTTAAIKRARDHTPGTVPLILEAAVSLLLDCPLARDFEEHVLKQSRPGAMSYSLRLSDRRQYHFRPGDWTGHDATSIYVYDRYKYGESEPLKVLSSREDVRTFFEGLSVEVPAVASERLRVGRHGSTPAMRWRSAHDRQSGSVRVAELRL
jgi:hypothetical protein